MNEVQGWLNVYKPLNISSFNVIKKIKKKFNIKKIGHAGTLDPLAEGILPIAVGPTTKLIPFVSDSIKEYEFKIKWGLQTSTDDREGEVISKSSHIPNINAIKEKIKKFKGNILQLPPKASAIKINGTRAYKLFRSNHKFEVKKRAVKIYAIRFIDSNEDTANFIIRCGKGFYVRSFARDLAYELGTKGHIYSLKRNKVGKFSLKNAILLDDLLKIRQTLFGFKDIHPSISMLDDILAYEIDDANLIDQIRHGKSIKIDERKLLDDNLNPTEEKIIFLTNKENILSFGQINGNLFKPKKVLI